MVRRVGIAAAMVALLAGCVSQPPQTPVGTSVTFAPTDCLAGLNGIDLNVATIADLQAALTHGRITSVQLVDAYLARIAAFDQAPSAGPLNSIRHLNPTARDQARVFDEERAAGHVRGPLHGIPILLKDNINTFDEPTTAGSIALANNVPPNDATVTQKLRDAGMVILGKTNMSEFASAMSSDAPAGYSSLGGQVVNAYTGPSGSPRGSSSGSGVAGSMAFAALTLGTHTSGSIVLPSMANSQAGLKPTISFVSRQGVIPVAISFDSVGPMGRNVADLAAAMDAMAGSDSLDPRTADADAHLPVGGFLAALHREALQGARIGFDPNATTSDPMFAQAIQDLRDAGAVLVPLQDRLLFGLAPDMLVHGTGPSGPYDLNEFKHGINDYLANHAGSGLPVSDLTGIILYNLEHRAEFEYDQNGLIEADATPGDRTLADLAVQPQVVASHEILDPYYEDNRIDAIVDSGTYYEGPGDFVGYPTLVVPMGYDGNMPRGLFINGQAWSDAKLLSYGYAFEQATKARIPPTVQNPTLVQGICA